MKIIVPDLSLPVVFQISIPPLWTHSQKNHMHTVVQLEGGNSQAVGIFKIKRLFFLKLDSCSQIPYISIRIWKEKVLLSLHMLLDKSSNQSYKNSLP